MNVEAAVARGRMLLLTIILVPTLLLAASADPPDRPESPSAVVALPDGSLGVLDSRLPGLWKRDAQGRLSVLVQGGSQDRTPLHSPRAVLAGPDGELYIADSSACDVFRIDPGQPPRPLSQGAFEVPSALALAEDGSLLVTDLRLGALFRLPRDGGEPVELARVPAPRGVAVLPGGKLAVLSMRPDQLVLIDPDGQATPWLRGTPFRFPVALLADGDSVLIADAYAASIDRVSPDGQRKPLFQGSLLVRPTGLSRDPDGALLIADPGARQVFRLTPGKALEPLLPIDKLARPRL